MNFLAKVKSWFGNPITNREPQPAPFKEAFDAAVERVEVVESRYEGSYGFFGERSLLPSSFQDARLDATPGVRISLAQKSRYWEKNSAIMNRLADLFEQFTVGPTGLRLIPNSEDAAWNEKVSAWWKEFSRAPEVDSNRTLAETMSLSARAWFVDGEVFILKTADAKGRPKIQLIEGHRVSTPTVLNSLEGQSIVDGVEVNAVGTPVAYHVRKMSANMSTGMDGLFPNLYTSTEDFERIPASRIVHLFEAVRPGMTRGLPFNYSVLNDLHDFEDLQIEEMKAVKAAADMACVWHTKTGEAPDSSNFRVTAKNIQTRDAAGNAVTKTSSVYYDNTQGGRDRYLKPGEDVKQFLTERPTVATQDFFDYLISKICAGCGISKLLVFPFSNQGTVVRSDLDTNARFFLSRSAVIANAFVNIFAWAVGWGKDWDRSLTGAPQQGWDRVLVRPPRSVNVDLGRNSNAMLAELEAGIRTRADIWAEQGEDWREQTEQLWIEAKFFEDMEAKYGVSRDKVLTLPKQQAPALSPIKLPAPNGAPAKAEHIPILLPNRNGSLSHHES